MKWLVLLLLEVYLKMQMLSEIDSGQEANAS